MTLITEPIRNPRCTEANAAHGDAVGHEDRRGVAVDGDRRADCRRDDDHRPHAGLISNRKSLDDVGRMTRLTGLGHRFHRGVRRVGEIARTLIQRHGEKHARPEKAEKADKADKLERATKAPKAEKKEKKAE